mmetsp:Transcript_68353/g.192774  ORF Transcript_68353/g.192774 Transcript_68353/m.192774 type:complete len:656 (-) Transcript_68353:92-2059(-)
MLAHSVPLCERRGYIYPHPFPGYAGAFLYTCDDSQPGQRGLGRGQFLWMLEIVAGSVRIEEHHPGHHSANTRYAFECKMKKKLMDLPEDAHDCLKTQRGNFIIETWRGEASKYKKAFHTWCDCTGPVEGTWSFNYPDPEVPLSRSALAGEYEFVMSQDDDTIHAVHRSWIDQAGVSVDDASGHMIRFHDASSICRHLIADAETRLTECLEKSSRALRDAHIQAADCRAPRRVVYYHARVAHVSAMQTVEESFKADIEVSLRYEASRSDVVSYFAHKMLREDDKPSDWVPSWAPQSFRVLNSADEHAVEVLHKPYRLDIDPGGGPSTGGGRARITKATRYTGTFYEAMELDNFPFDCQWFHCRLEAEQPPNAELPVELLPDPDSGRLRGEDCRKLRKVWCHDAWSLRDVDVLGASQEAEGQVEGAPRAYVTRVYVGVSVKRRHFGLLMRTLAILFLVEGVSLMAFMLHPVDDLADRINLIFMMMLTSAAYSNVVADMLPPLGYLTFLDWYIIASYVFFTGVAMQLGLVGLVGRDLQSEDGPQTTIGKWLDSVGWADLCDCDSDMRRSIHTIDSYCMFADLGVLLLAHAALLLHCLLIIVPRERHKPMDEPFQESGRAEDPGGGWFPALDSDSRRSETDSDNDDMDASRPLMSRRSR